jgi:hypothetical protein
VKVAGMYKLAKTKDYRRDSVEDERRSTAELENNNTPAEIDEEEYETDGEESPEEPDYDFYRLARLLADDGATRLEPQRAFI